MDEQEFERILALGREQRAVEFKSAGSTGDRAFMAKVIRAVLAMTNKRDGGRVIIGVTETDSGLSVVGLTAEQLATWRYDDVSSLIATYADPMLIFSLETFEYRGASCLIMDVEEFPEIPVLCRRDYTEGRSTILRQGACYVRGIRRIESAEVSSQQEMRELVELAVDKGVKRWVARTWQSGIPSLPPIPGTASDRERFQGQLGDLNQ